MISLVEIPVHRCYTGNTVRLEGYAYGSYWLTYVSCSHYKCIVTQNAAEISTCYKSTAAERLTVIASRNYIASLKVT